ncbi:MAG: alcohol dehydrogenase catalytic domain-containing protein [Acidobacteriota bacterium]
MQAQTMLSAVFAAEGVLELREHAVPVVRQPDDVLIEVEGCGICGTDLHILEVPPGHPATPGVILGHEYLGRVRAVGCDVNSLKLGTRVAVAPNLHCDRCQFCRAGFPNHCRNFTTLGIFRDGGLAPYNVAPERACHPLSQEVPFEDAVWTELLSCVTHSVSNVKPLVGETALVIGAGPVGALHAMLLQAGGVRVIVSDLQSVRRRLLADLGVQRTVNPNREDVREVIETECRLGADIVVDTVGSQFNLAVETARVGGRVSLFGMDSQARPTVCQNAITRKELTVYGSYVGAATFPSAIAILESGVIKPSRLISEVFPLQEVNRAIDSLRKGSMMKAVVSTT